MRTAAVREGSVPALRGSAVGTETPNACGAEEGLRQAAGESFARNLDFCWKELQLVPRAQLPAKPTVSCRHDLSASSTRLSKSMLVEPGTSRIGGQPVIIILRSTLLQA